VRSTTSSKGGTLVVTRVDRLARSIADLQDIVRALEAKRAALYALNEAAFDPRLPDHREGTVPPPPVH
jgi:DNA invertase Pin-like site-specific DNA recombinase